MVASALNIIAAFLAFAALKPMRIQAIVREGPAAHPSATLARCGRIRRRSNTGSYRRGHLPAIRDRQSAKV
jgi:hypothetical protein